MNEYIDRILSQLPDLCSNNDLVQVGIFRSINEAHLCRKKGKSPDYFKLPNKHVIYSKEAVKKFLEESFNDGKEPRKETRPYHKKTDAV